MTRIPVALKKDLPQNTGWRVVPGVAEALDPTSGRFMLRREGRVVTLRLEDVVLAAGSGNSKLLDIPTGFKPPGYVRNVYQVVRRNLVASTSINTLVVWAAQLSWLEVPGTSRPTSGALGGISGEISWTTDEAWPATLPGTPY